MRQILLVFILLFMTTSIIAQSEQHDVNQAEEAEEFKPTDTDTDTRSEQHDVNQAQEAEEFKPADED